MRDEDTGKDDNEEGESSNSKDLLIKRKVSLGQAISVVGGYDKSQAPEEAPLVKRLPEPIVPSAQTK